ncbi:imidazolonepropionase-like domain-containing protein [Streptomyces yaizuensis]|uniref:Aminodeoxyfutalosine deaminase/Imidazolonepropionase-like composite domain-containing protein n=1 Tax=Streptomyces yaizuensis TaxID=2989713 RepID=A0ABQ5P4D3_9ACTN|nr:hypothetical protein [Streptomyces sp. YSPA8]GLF97451.1 hypothetical protein SYYSPA8_24160 [Streptomyces sp. YSPA8]
MLTLHIADALLTGDGPLRPGPHAVLVDGGTVRALGPYGELAAAHPGARERRWPGLLAPGLWHTSAGSLLEAAYHPDPREADALGTEPLTGAALAALELGDTGWGGSARRGIQRLLAHGCTVVSGPFTRAPVRTALARSGLRVRTVPPDAPGILFAGALGAGSPADFAVFTGPAVPLTAEDLAEGPAVDPARLARDAECAATVLAGRLVHRRR